MNGYSKHDDILWLKYDLIFCFLAADRARRHLNVRREKQLNVRPGDIILEFINIIYWPPAGNVGSVICEGRIVVKRTKLHNIYILILEKFILISDLCKIGKGMEFYVISNLNCKIILLRNVPLKQATFSCFHFLVGTAIK